MRMYALAIAMALFAQPAWAHHRPNQPDHRPDRSAIVRVAFDPCGGVSNGPHESPALQAMARRCHTLRAELARNPDNAEARLRCDRLARALTGRNCDAGRN